MTQPRGTAPATDLSLEEAGALAPLVTPQEAAARVAEGALLIDVRGDAGRAEHGTIPDAVIADRYDLDAALSAGSRSRITRPDSPIVVICGSVRGSGPVAAALLARGFTDVVHVDGGFAAWRDAGLPVIAPGQTTA